MLETLGLLSGVLGFICFIPYIRDILLKKAKPERMTWLIWMTLGSIAFFSQLAKGATNSLWLTGIDTLGVAVTFFLSLKYGKGGIAFRDIVALIIALLGLVLWYFTREAAFALYIVILVDLAGSSLTVMKAYEDPESETMAIWILSGFSGLVATFAVGSFNWILLSYPIYICLANWVVIVAMLLGRKKGK